MIILNKFGRLTPPGTRDYLFEECAAAKAIERSVTAVFEAKGYQEVMTPGIEYYDMFTQAGSGIPQEQLYKLVGTGGRILVLRPDTTLPIARMVGARLKDAEMPIRLFYTQNVFRVSPLMCGSMDEIIQSGIELIGQSGAGADLEVISTAVQALGSLHIENFRIELGHAGFFKALVSELNVDDQAREQIRLSIESKNFALLGQLLDDVEESRGVRAIRGLPRLFGGREVFAQAAKLCGGNKKAEKSLNYLEDTYNKLVETGFEGSISVDLGLVHRNDYYTGLVFRGYIEGSGVTVLSGGRYDRLLSEFGVDLPATGFAIENSALIPLMLEKALKDV